MANLPESSVWETGIYQLEETDPVQGGANGIDNQQGKQLANRTVYLKGLVDSLGIGKLDLSALASQAEAIAGTDNTKWMTPLRVAQAIVALANIAMATDASAGKVELATNAETVTGTDTQRATHPAGVKAAIAAAIAAVVDSSPATLNTLNELANALGNDPNFATSIATLIAGKQPLDATLSALAGITVAGNQLIYATGADAFATTDLSAFMRTLLDDADASAARATLGVGNVAFSKEYVSPAQTIVAGGLMTLSHSLGVIPKIVTLEYMCTTTTDGYSIGDVIDSSNFNYDHTDGVATGFSTEKTASQLLIRCGSGGPAFFPIKSGGGSIAISNIAPNFKLVARAFA